MPCPDLRRRELWLEVPERMDGADTDPHDLDRALRELGVVHNWLGGARTASRGLRWLVRRAGERARGGAAAGPPLRILDVGCGGGELARGARRWLRPRTTRTVLLDFNRDACLWARRSSFPEPAVLQANAFRLPVRDRSVDIVHCGLFLHHFDTADAARLIAGLLPLCRVGVVVSDLHRHRLPHTVTAWGVRCLSRSAMVRHDAPLSVARGFTRPELAEIAQRAGTRWTVLQRVWPWRWLGVIAVDG